MIGRRILLGWVNDDHTDPHNVLMVESPEGHPGWLSLKDIFSGAKRDEQVSIVIETICDECRTRAVNNATAQIHCGDDCHVSEPVEEPVSTLIDASNFTISGGWTRTIVPRPFYVVRKRKPLPKEAQAVIDAARSFCRLVGRDASAFHRPLMEAVLKYNEMTPR